MKRRNRKRSSKAAGPLKIPSDAGKPPGPSFALAVADNGTYPRDKLTAAVEAEKLASNSIAPAGADRRTHPRYEFTAAASYWRLNPERGLKRASMT